MKANKRKLKNKFKVGDKVYDVLWPYSIGTIKKILKTRVKIQFAWHDLITYDNEHLQFLRLCRKNKKKCVKNTGK